MDEIVRNAVRVALFGGTGAVIVMVLPRIVIVCLEIVGQVHARRLRRTKPGTAVGSTPSVPFRS